MIVLACNTATSVVWEEVKAALPIPVLGVILPGASAAIKSTQTGHVGVIGTQMTVCSDIYRQKIQSLSPETEVVSLACPKFVPLVESNEMTSSLAKKVVYETLKPLKGKVDTLVLGCTHYPLLRPIIQHAMGPEVKLIDSGAETARDISVLLNYFEINHDRNQSSGEHQFYTTASPEAFKIIAEDWLDRQIQVEQIRL